MRTIGYGWRLLLAAGLVLGAGPALLASEVFEEAPPAEPPTPEAELHPLTYPDGKTTPNDRCPIRKRKLSSKIEPVWVNQHPVGFC